MLTCIRMALVPVVSLRGEWRRNLSIIGGLEDPPLANGLFFVVKSMGIVPQTASPKIFIAHSNDKLAVVASSILI